MEKLNEREKRSKAIRRQRHDLSSKVGKNRLETGLYFVFDFLLTALKLQRGKDRRFYGASCNNSSAKPYFARSLFANLLFLSRFRSL